MVMLLSKSKNKGVKIMKENIEPSKSIRIINVLNKVMFVISIIVLVIAAIGVISGIIGTILILVNKDTLVGEEQLALWFKILQETSKHGHEAINIYTLALYTLNGAIYSLGILLISFFSFKYFKTNIKNNTVFTPSSSKGIFKLGLINIITGLAVMLICVIIYSIFINVFRDDYRLLGTEIRYVGFGWAGLGIGLIFLVISLFINAYNENILKSKK